MGQKLHLIELPTKKKTKFTKSLLLKINNRKITTVELTIVEYLQCAERKINVYLNL